MSSSPSKMTNENIRSAVSLWCTDRDACLELYGHVKDWDVSAVTDMRGLFKNMEDFDEDISQWEVDNVEDMSMMFWGAKAFNQDLSQWKVGKVRNMSLMFTRAASFDQDIGEWLVDNVENMTSMFWGASSFNQNLNKWVVSNVKEMTCMFRDAVMFDQPLDNWDVQNVHNMSSMFWGARVFNQEIGCWVLSSLTNMSSMFWNAEKFNQDVSNWDVSNVTSMRCSFNGASMFNQNLGKWQVSNVTDMSKMFRDAEAFAFDLGEWDVSNVTSMDSMFYGAAAMQVIFVELNVSSMFEDNFLEIPSPLRETAFRVTKFFKAAGGGHTDVLKDILDTGADVDMTNSEDWTALMVAAHENQFDVLTQLLEAGANIGLVNKDGMSAIDMAQDEDSKKLLEGQPKPTKVAGVKYIPRSAVQKGRRIGGGTFGQVFEAVYEEDTVALKCFGDTGLLTEKSVREVRNEVDIMSRLDHTSLVRMLGFVCEEEQCEHPPMLVMEYGTHGSLYSYLNSDNVLEVNDRLRIAGELSKGLSYLHSKGVIHSDIKSLNVVLFDGLKAKWCDFGLSSLKMMHTAGTMSMSMPAVSGSNSSSGELPPQPQCGVGTIRWMAPERFVPGSLLPTFRSDIWAFGMVLYELGTNKVPYSDAVHDEQVKECIREWNGVVPDSCGRGSELSVLGDVMLRCWAKVPNHRPTAAEVKEILAPDQTSASVDQTVQDDSLQSGIVMHGSTMNSYPPPPPNDA